MSIHVLKRKMNEKTKLTKQNQYASSRGEPFALNVTNRGSIRSNLGSSFKKDGTVIMTGCCGGNRVRKPAISQSYFNYHRRSLGGLGNLAARVVTVRSPAVNGSTHQMVTYKRAPEVGQSQYVKDKKIKALTRNRSDGNRSHCLCHHFSKPLEWHWSSYLSLQAISKS